LNECASQPCLNGATCHDLENNYRCTCPTGWTGDHCEQDVDECSALVTPCIRASACININGSYICVCEKGFEGLFCENEVDDCKHNQINCQNGGFCIDLVNDFRCVCATGFTGPRCDRIDESVCELLPNHVWRLNETGCEKICVCHNNKVSCKCQEESRCNLKLADRTNLSEIRVVFDSNASRQACNAIQSIHSLLTIDDDDDDDGEFCCEVRMMTDSSMLVTNGNEIIIQVDKQSSLAQYISRQIFPHILHVIVNNENIRQSDWTVVNFFIIIIFTAIIVTGILMAKSYFRRRKHEQDAENVVIHCIQNNLKISQKQSPTTIRSITPPNQKLCNTFGGSQMNDNSFHQTKILPYCSKLMVESNKPKMID
ncbi:hypothetical protein BLA29_007160, partial [Euroglyphus maynei]